MKITLLHILGITLVTLNIATAQTEYTAIPDSNFEKALEFFDDMPGDGKIPTAAISEIKSLAVKSKGIVDLTGIEDFIKLEALNCDDNKLTTLSLSVNSNLTVLSCAENQLSQLDLSANAKLQILNCKDNKLTSINLKNNNNPTLGVVITLDNPDLKCILIDDEDAAIAGEGVYGTWRKDGFSRYTEDCNADVTKRYTIVPDPEFEKALVTFDNSTGIGDGLIPTANIIDVKKLVFRGNIIDITGIEGFKSLEFLGFTETGLVDVDFSSNVALKELICMSGRLESINLSGNPLLEELDCSKNKITALDLSKNPRLQILNCSENNLQEIDCSNNLQLKVLSVANNQLTELDITKNEALTLLNFSENKIERFDPTRNLKLRSIACENNRLQTLDVSRNNNISINCSFNQLSFINAKNDIRPQSMEIDSRENDDALCIQVSDPKLATNKEGTYKNWKEDSTTAYSDNCKVLSVDDFSKKVGVKIYPNPSSGILNIPEGSVIDQIEVIGVTGNNVKTFDLKRSKIKNIDLSNFLRGVYFLKITSENSIVTKKIILN